MAYGIWKNNKLLATFVVPLTLRSNQPMFVSDTLSLKRALYQRAAQRWELETKLAPQGVSAHELMVDLVMNGYSEAIKITTPQNVGAKASLTATSNVVVATTTAASNTQVPLSGVSSDQAGKVIPMGTFINFNNVGKVYMLAQNITLSTTGMTANIYPALRNAVTSGDLVYYKDDVLMNVKYDTDVVRGMVYEDGLLMNNGTVKFIEAL
jgi:hypothetical protein